MTADPNSQNFPALKVQGNQIQLLFCIAAQRDGLILPLQCFSLMQTLQSFVFPYKQNTLRNTEL